MTDTLIKRIRRSAEQIRKVMDALDCKGLKVVDYKNLTTPEDCDGTVFNIEIEPEEFLFNKAEVFDECYGGAQIPTDPDYFTMFYDLLDAKFAVEAVLEEWLILKDYCDEFEVMEGGEIRDGKYYGAIYFDNIPYGSIAGLDEEEDE